MDDVSRFDQFCQFRRIIRGSRQHLVVGVEQTELLLQQHQLKEVVFGLEPTGNYHKPLAHWLIQQNFLVVLVAGKAVKDNRELLDGRWDKNDTKDCANVAELVSQGKCQFYEQPDSVLIAVRNLIVVRKQLKKEEHKLRMRIRKGDAHLRYSLYQAALIASYHNDGFRRLYHRMLDGRQGERGIKTKARVKIAAKMLVIAWTMLKNNEPFDEMRLSAESIQQR